MTSFACLRDGFKLIFASGVKRYAFGPLLLNILLYALIATYMFREFSQFMDWGLGFIPDWLHFLVPIAWLTFAIIGLLIIGYTFAIFAMIIGSPFHGLLAEKVAVHLGYRSFDEKLTLAVFMRITKRALSREWIKLLYNLPRAVGVVLLALALGFIPLLGLLAPVITFLWAAWSMAIQFIDYPADNDQVDFRQMLRVMHVKRSKCLWFGGTTALLLSVPVLNLLVIPAAVAGATKLWLEQLDQTNASSTSFEIK